MAKKTQEELKRQRDQRVDKRIARAMYGGSFSGDLPDLNFRSPSAYRRQINAYFDWCERHKEPMTVPGLALVLGVRTKALQEYNPGAGIKDGKEWRRLTEFAIQRIENGMAKALHTATGATKGKEFLAQNTLGYANKSDVNSKASLEVSEKERLQTLSDDELKEQLAGITHRIIKFTGAPVKAG